MRTLVPLIVGAFVLVGSVFASDVALNAPASSCSLVPGTNSCSLAPITVGGTTYTFTASNADDGITTNEWVAPGGTMSPYLLIALPQAYTGVTSVVIDGLGNTGDFSSFNVYAGTVSSLTLANLESMPEIYSTTNQADSSSGWSQTITAGLPAAIQYVLYLGTGAPGTGTQDDANVAEILVNTATTTPEPTTMGLISLSLLTFGLVRRRRSRT